MSWKVGVAALVAGVVVIPAAAAATAKHHHPAPQPLAPGELALVPLQQEQLGKAGVGLAVSQTSGYVSNEAAAAGANGIVSPLQLKKLGRVGGEDFAYGDAYSGGPAVNRIETRVDRYRTPAGAAKGLLLWKKDVPKITALAQLDLAVSSNPIRVKSLVRKHFADFAALSIPGVPVDFRVTEELAYRSYVLSVVVDAGSAVAAEHLAPRLARRLVGRLHKALAGQLIALPVEVPPVAQPGPPPGGPDPGGMAIMADDVGQTVIQNQIEGYSAEPDILSEYNKIIEPAGRFGDLFQTLYVVDDPVEATWVSRLEVASFLRLISLLGPGAGAGLTQPVDLSSVGDHATGVIVGGGSAFVALSAGPVADFVLVDASTVAITAASVRSLAQAAATRLNAGLAG